jgi:hypothetical protein
MQMLFDVIILQVWSVYEFTALDGMEQQETYPKIDTHRKEYADFQIMLQVFYM